ncbi:MAG: DUF1844 domain-containing protein [Phycisphaerales bacterium JB065]
MADESGEAPKLIIDSDWKSEAQAEREKLAAAEKQAAEKPEGPGEGEMPKADFRGLMGMLATQALMYMGGIADPNTGKPVFDPMYAQHMIDLLGVLEEKTKGNLTEEEAGEIAGVLHELRSRFVELMQIVAKQQATAGTGPMPPQG